MNDTELQFFLGALKFASEKHLHLKRKDVEKTPYIHHPIRVAELICRVGGVNDPILLSAALLHDVIEDTGTKPEEIADKFGEEVANIVQEVTDDKTIKKEKRKELQILHAPNLSRKAKIIKLADKICNVKDIGSHPPADWDLEERMRYLEWSQNVVAGLRGINQPMEDYFDQTLAAATQKVTG